MGHLLCGCDSYCANPTPNSLPTQQHLRGRGSCLLTELGFLDWFICAESEQMPSETRTMLIFESPAMLLLSSALPKEQHTRHPILFP